MLKAESLSIPDQRQIKETPLHKVTLEKVSSYGLYLPDLEAVTDIFRLFSSRDFQEIPLSEEQVKTQRKILETDPGLSKFSEREVDFFEKYYKLPMTGTEHVEAFLSDLNRSFKHPNAEINDKGKYGRNFFGTSFHIDKLGEKGPYIMLANSEYCGIEIEERVAIAKDLKRVIRPRAILAEYKGVDREFALDLDNIRKKISSLLAYSTDELSAYSVWRREGEKKSMYTITPIPEYRLGSSMELELKARLINIAGVDEPRGPSRMLTGRVETDMLGSALPLVLEVTIMENQNSSLYRTRNHITPRQRVAADSLAEKIKDTFS